MKKEKGDSLQLTRDVNAKNRENFLKDYDALCLNYGLMIQGQMTYTPNGIIIQPVLVEIKKNESGK